MRRSPTRGSGNPYIAEYTNPTGKKKYVGAFQWEAEAALERARKIRLSLQGHARVAGKKGKKKGR